MASIELLDEETLNVTLSDDIGLESNINEPESINVEQLPNDYTPSYTESDPIFVSSPAASIKEDDITNWNSKSDFDGDYESLTNKPTIPTVPTNLSSFTDDLGSSPTHTHSQYLTEHQDISGKVDKETGKGLSSNDFTDTYKSDVDSNTTARHTHSNKSVLDDISSSDVSSWDSKQEALVSGTNIKTINNQSLLGSGNITIEGGGGTATDVQINGTSITSNDVANIVTEGTYNASTNKIATKSDIPTKTSDLTNDSGFITSFGNAKTYYGTSSTSASTAAKVATCSGFTLETGATIFIKFTNGNSYNGTATLNVNSTGAKTICSVGTTETTRYYWKSGEVVGFVYDGTNYTLIEKAPATTTYYGITKLSSSTSSTSEALAATPKAVKTAYDLADSKQDEITSTNKLDYSLIDNTPTIPTVPTTVSSFTNDAGYITGITSSDVTTALGYTPEEEIPVISINDILAVTSTSDALYVQLYDLITHQRPFYVDDNQPGDINTYMVIHGTYFEDIGGDILSFDYSDGNGDFCTVYLTRYYNHPSTIVVTTSVYSTTDAQINGTKVSNIITNTAYNSSTNKIATMSDVPDISVKQDTLVSGTNIKTINGNSILGSGNISIGGGLTFDDIYPVGSIYMSVNNTSPATLFGGTWVQIKDTFLLSAGDTYTAGDTGGSATHTLTVDEIPSHKHRLGVPNTTSSTTGYPVNQSGSTKYAFNSGAALMEETGGGQPHNNMPPYLVVYMWQRTS